MSECDVCIGTNEDISSDFYHETHPKARKPAKCAECGGVVPVGTHYWKIVQKYEGELCVTRQCEPCHEIQWVFACGKNFTFTTLWEDMEYVFESLRTSSPCFQKLSMPARNFLVDRWWEWKERNRGRQ